MGTVLGPRVCRLSSTGCNSRYYMSTKGENASSNDGLRCWGSYLRCDCWAVCHLRLLLRALFCLVFGVWMARSPMRCPLASPVGSETPWNTPVSTNFINGRYTSYLRPSCATCASKSALVHAVSHPINRSLLRWLSHPLLEALCSSKRTKWWVRIHALFHTMHDFLPYGTSFNSQLNSKSEVKFDEHQKTKVKQETDGGSTLYVLSPSSLFSSCLSIRRSSPCLSFFRSSSFTLSLYCSVLFILSFLVRYAEKCSFVSTSPHVCSDRQK